MRGAWLASILIWAATAWAQNTGAPQSAAQPVRPVGVVAQVQSNSFILHTDAGPNLLIQLADGVSVVRVPAGARDLNTATKIEVKDISVGDRVLVRGRASDDQKSVLAASVIVMTKSDLATAREAERLDWERRGIGGSVTAVNSDTKEISISTPTSTAPGNPRSVNVTLAANAVLLRYAPDSVKFSDTRPGTFEEIKVGDQIRALGAKSADGTRFSAEQVVSGTFRNLGVTVISVDAQQSSVTAKDLASGQTVLTRISADTRLHRLPPALAKALAAPNSATGPGELQQTLEGTPAIALGDLKPGDLLIVVSTEGVKPSEVTAITVFAGVEPILANRPSGGSQSVPGTWNLGMGANQGGP